MANNRNDSGETPKIVAMVKNHEQLYEILDDKNAKPIKTSSKSLLKRKSSFSTKRSSSKKKLKEREKKKETIIIDQTENQSLLDLYKLPDFEGKEGESVIDAISNNPELLAQMKENPEVFLKYIPRDMQELLIKDVEKNPYLLQEVVQMGKEVLEQVLEEHPEQLLSAMQNPFQLFKKANTPTKLMKLIRQLEENPMIVLKDEFQNDPELFLIKELKNNPRLLYLVVQKVRNTKPELLPLIRVVIGVNADENDSTALEKKEKGITGKMKSKVVKAAVNKFTKKMNDNEDPDLEKMDLSGFMGNHANSQEMEQFRQFMKADAAQNLKDCGVSGPLFTMEEYYVKVDADGNEIIDDDVKSEPVEQLDDGLDDAPIPQEEDIAKSHAANYLDLD